MIVCVCNALREKDVQEAARSGARSPGRAYRQFGCRTQCGQCLPFARMIIEREHAAAC
ncbi:MAG TPA: (2Fe-2S)-binding protein [Chakrabartia sp.]|nr:(2Fe-2S)-binding protein [Chakrabartia sp.]